jgi:hypothetical protein
MRLQRALSPCVMWSLVATSPTAPGLQRSSSSFNDVNGSRGASAKSRLRDLSEAGSVSINPLASDKRNWS